jgi:RNA polymerase sigma-70 factor, ECF subfamily
MMIVAEHEQLPIAAARAGEPGAWDILFRRYQLPLYTYVYEWVHHEQSSLDIVQETFISASRHLDDLREDAKFGGWLFGIAHQKCVQHWRRQDRHAETMETEDWPVPETEEDPASELVRQEQETAFLQLLGELPPPQRSVLLLYYLEEFSLEEISAVTGAALGTVKSRLHYARKTLRTLWENQNENTP